MSNTVKLIAACLPFVFAAVLVLLLPHLRESALAKLVSEPLATTTHATGAGDEVLAEYQVRTVRPYAVLDLGRLRIAVEGQSTISTLAEGSIPMRSVRSAFGKTSDFKWETAKEGNTVFTFVGRPFRLVDCELDYDGVRIDANGEPTLVVIGKDGRIVEVKPIQH